MRQMWKWQTRDRKWHGKAFSFNSIYVWLTPFMYIFYLKSLQYSESHIVGIQYFLRFLVENGIRTEMMSRNEKYNSNARKKDLWC